MAGAQQRTARHRYIFIVPCYALFIVIIGCLKQLSKTSIGVSTEQLHIGRHVLQAPDDPIIPQCIPPGIDAFPDDFFTQEQRRMGGVVVHFILLIYSCAMLTCICDEYFVPSLDIICQRLKIPSDVAGATFMAIGTSSPELFSSIIGVFITENDIGVGTIVGSAVFNILGVTGLAGVVLWSTEVSVDWYPITRDCSVYLVTVAVLTAVISNNIVTWWEALIMLVMFGMYIILMYFNAGLDKFCHRQVKKIETNWICCRTGERTPLVNQENNASSSAAEVEIPRPNKVMKRDSYSIDFSQVKKEVDELYKEDTDNNEESCSPWSPCSMPDTPLQRLWYIVMWPASLIFFITIPDCKRENFKKFFLLTFLSSTVWLGALSYLSVWMVTIIGYTLGIPDTVSGLTLLAAGTSLPEIISSIIVVKNGLGNMVMSNLIGSNIFDILFCLGAPWLIRTLVSDEGFLVINSSAMTYITTTLLVTVVAILLVFHVSSWKLNRTMGFFCILLYIIFVVLACLYEMNILGDFNPPPC